MKKEYGFSNSTKNPYMEILKNKSSCNALEDIWQLNGVVGVVPCAYPSFILNHIQEKSHQKKSPKIKSLRHKSKG